MARECDVLVVGGGLGGLALAIALQELDMDFLLAEAADQLRTATGTLIGIGNNGLHALEQINPKIVEGLKECSQLTTRSVFNLRPRGGEQAPEVTSTQLASPLHTIRWAATQRVLAGLVDPSRVLCGHKCTGYDACEQGEEGAGGEPPRVRVHFKGQPDISARLVIGADGVRSALRARAFPSDPGPRYLGFVNWNAVRHVPGSSAQPGADSVNVVVDRREGFSAMVYLINAGCDYKFWQVRVPCDGAPQFTNGSSAGAGVPGSKARVLQLLRELGWDDAAEEVEATDEGAIYERAMWDLLPLESWSAEGGRVLLLGDAAHAMYSGPGQGARTAFEDAHQLMLALKQHWPDLQAVAEQYEAARVHRATIIQAYAAGMSNLQGLAAAINGFWATLDGAATDDGRRERFREFQLWLNSYPERMHGLPESKYTTPQTLAAFREHCAAATARHAPQQLHQRANGCGRDGGGRAAA